MGLEAVELMMEIEERFHVTIPDVDFHRIRTVADLAALVIKHLPHTEEVCGTARAFFEVRRLLVTQAGLDRKQVRPETRLTDLFPPASRRRWNLLYKKDRRVPPLVATDRAEAVLRWAGGIGTLTWIFASAAMCASLGPVVLILLTIVVFAIALWAFVVAARFFSKQFPPGLETVGDVARFMVPIALGKSGSGERLVAEQQVLEEMRRLLSEKLGVPLDRVQPTSDLINDLKLD